MGSKDVLSYHWASTSPIALAHICGGALGREGRMAHASCLDLVSSKLLSGCPELLLPQSCGLCVVDLARDSFPSIYLGTVGLYLDLATPSR